MRKKMYRKSIWWSIIWKMNTNCRRFDAENKKIIITNWHSIKHQVFAPVCVNCNHAFNCSEWNLKKKIWTWTCPSLVYVPFPVIETSKHNKTVAHNVPLPHLIKTNEYPNVISCRLTPTARPTEWRTIQTIVFHLINYRIHNIRNGGKSFLRLHENRITWAGFGSATRDTIVRAKKITFRSVMP